jgi:hypothetical protein
MGKAGESRLGEAMRCCRRRSDAGIQSLNERAEGRQDVCLHDEQGNILSNRRVVDGLEGVRRLHESVRHRGSDNEASSRWIWLLESDQRLDQRLDRVIDRRQSADFGDHSSTGAGRVGVGEQAGAHHSDGLRAPGPRRSHSRFSRPAPQHVSEFGEQVF